MAKLKEDLRKQIDYYHSKHSRGAALWSLAHHGVLFGSAILSATAGFVLQFENSILPCHSENASLWNNNEFAAVLAFLAAIMGTIGSSGGFQRKWQTNRRTKVKLEALRLDYFSKYPDEEKIKTALKQIIKEHEPGISGGGEDGKKNADLKNEIDNSEEKKAGSKKAGSGLDNKS